MQIPTKLNKSGERKIIYPSKLMKIPIIRTWLKLRWLEEKVI